MDFVGRAGDPVAAGRPDLADHGVDADAGFVGMGRGSCRRSGRIEPAIRRGFRYPGSPAALRRRQRPSRSAGGRSRRSACPRALRWCRAGRSRSGEAGARATGWSHSCTASRVPMPPRKSASPCSAVPSAAKLDGIEPRQQRVAAGRPLVADDAVPVGVALPPFDQHVHAVAALIGKAQALRRALRGRVQGVALPYQPPVAQIIRRQLQQSGKSPRSRPACAACAG